MTDASDKLQPANRDDLLANLSYGMRFNTSGKPIRGAHDVAVAALAETVLGHLERSGYVVMKKPAASAPSVPASPGRLTE
jgi:hypothetical protein